MLLQLLLFLSSLAASSPLLSLAVLVCVPAIQFGRLRSRSGCGSSCAGRYSSSASASASASAATSTNTTTATSSRCHSVNYHFLRECNYACKFCFHTDTTRSVLKIDKIKTGLRQLRDAGMQKINFSGGEPFLKAALLGEMVDYCKQELGLNVSIVTNGSLIREQWIKQHAASVDILAISCDSADDDINADIGRRARSSSADEQTAIARRVAQWCREYKIDFKLNTVVTTLNADHDMSELLGELRPRRWKVFQCLLLEGENLGENAKRDARDMVVPEDKFQAFIERHRRHHPVVEDNKDMRDSYLILDQDMCFLDCTSGAKIPSKSILDVGVEAALDDSGFDAAAFERRGGRYDYSKQCEAKQSTCGGGESVADIEDLM
jgi:radical S-adenosyl methionine domain-containing protein 2